jgi:hypothetical protein
MLQITGLALKLVFANETFLPKICNHKTAKGALG